MLLLAHQYGILHPRISCRVFLLLLLLMGKFSLSREEGKLYCLDENTDRRYGVIKDYGTLVMSRFRTAVFVTYLNSGVYAFGENTGANLSLSLDSEMSLLGFKVTLTETLESNGTAIGGASVLLSYSFTGGESWSDIAMAETTADGSYSAVWVPSAIPLFLSSQLIRQKYNAENYRGGGPYWRFSQPLACRNQQRRVHHYINLL